jgi:hypothetical protein
MLIIRLFDELGRGDVDVAGGKGANLGELTRAGLPVPPGFVLTAAAYREFVASSGIADQVLALAALPSHAEPGAYEEPSARIRELFSSAAVPEAVATKVLDARALLGEDAVAVRSSATAEDFEGATFAGQQDTYLNVRGTDALLAAARDCWASLWTARAMAYRARQGIDPSAVALAVVVQRMVDADAAGVMFTANPTNGRRDETVVSAAWGLGESVVSGSVTTDDVVVEMPSGRVRSRTTADKAVMTVATDHGTEEQAVPAVQRARPVLDDALVRRDGDPPAPTFLLGFDSAPIQAEKPLYDLATWARRHDDLARALLATPSIEVVDRLDGDGSPAGVDPTIWQEWRARDSAGRAPGRRSRTSSGPTSPRAGYGELTPPAGQWWYSVAREVPTSRNPCSPVSTRV